jgi:cytochrome c-type biogenesis protein CcmF
MAAFGSFALLIALALAAYNLLAGALALRLIATGQPARISPERLADTARRAGIVGFLAVTAAAFALIWSVFTNDFSITYILEHSNRALPGAYKFSALWSGQEGSLLLWAWLLGIYGFVLIMAGIQVFFLAVLNFAAPPFALLKGAIPYDGNGLNPLLQYPEMVIHPPMLYLGYVGFSVPFAFALGALMMRYPGEKWIKVTRVWTLVTWLFLTAGIFLGMHWAYAVLGWGGYWGWDPVENASFMPWLTGTAFLHSVMMQEKKGMMKSWNVWLIFSTFLLTLLGTLLTRAGLVSSVHAFAQSSIGTWVVVFMGIVLAVCIFTYVLQRSHLKSEHHLESLVSRESSFLFNNLVLLTACFVILWGTLFPILSEYAVGNKVTVGAPFYNRVAIPIGLFLLFLTGLGPLLPWRSTSLKSIRRNFVVPIMLRGRRQSLERRHILQRKLLCDREFRRLRGRAHRHPLRIPARRGRHLPPNRPQPPCLHMAAYPPQHAKIRRLHHSHRSCHRRRWPCRRGLQHQRGKRTGLARQAAHRPLHARVHRLHPGLEPQLQLRIRHARRLPRRQKAVPDDSREARLPG